MTTLLKGDESDREYENDNHDDDDNDDTQC
jgi:hypothetical protein